MGKYDREEIIQKLRKHGLRAIYSDTTGALSHFEAPPHMAIGIKCRGYLDFLNVNVIQRKYNREHNREHKRAWHQ